MIHITPLLAHLRHALKDQERFKDTCPLLLEVPKQTTYPCLVLKGARACHGYFAAIFVVEVTVFSQDKSGAEANSLMDAVQIHWKNASSLEEDNETWDLAFKESAPKMSSRSDEWMQRFTFFVHKRFPPVPAEEAS